MLFSLLLMGSALFGSPALAADAPAPCKECHEEKYNAPMAHYPAQEGICEVCHTATKKHFETMDPKEVVTQRSQQVCYECHEKKDAGKHVHPALQMSDDSCISCHNPHGGQLPTLLKNKLPNLCFDCHDSTAFSTGKSVHKVTMTGKSCAKCHDAHSSNLPKLLPQEPEKVCISCHNREIRTAERVIPNIKAKIENSKSVHAVAEGCGNCHSPHASQFDRLLADQFSMSDYTRYFPGDDKTPNSYALCFTCHDVAILDRKSKETGFRADRRNGVIIESVNLHWVHVTNATGTTGPDRGRSCKVCHDPHGAPQEHLLKDRLFKGNAKMEFVAKDNGGTCTKSCHSPKGYERLQ